MPAKSKGEAEDTPTTREWQNERGWVIQLLVHPNRSSAILVRHGQAHHILYKVYDYWELNRAEQDVELLASLGECEEMFNARAA